MCWAFRSSACTCFFVETNSSSHVTVQSDEELERTQARRQLALTRRTSEIKYLFPFLPFIVCDVQCQRCMAKLYISLANRPSIKTSCSQYFMIGRARLFAVNLQPHVPPPPGLFVTLKDPVHLDHFRESFAGRRLFVVVTKADKGKVREEISLRLAGEPSATKTSQGMGPSHLCPVRRGLVVCAV